MGFGELLKRHRDKLDWNQEMLAQMAGCDSSYISKLERGVTPPPSRRLTLRLAKSLKLAKNEANALLSSANHAVTSDEELSSIDLKAFPNIPTDVTSKEELIARFCHLAIQNIQKKLKDSGLIAEDIFFILSWLDNVLPAIIEAMIENKFLELIPSHTPSSRALSEESFIFNPRQFNPYKDRKP